MCVCLTIDHRMYVYMGVWCGYLEKPRRCLVYTFVIFVVAASAAATIIFC